MGIRQSVGKNKKSNRPAAAVGAKRGETVRKGLRARPRARNQRKAS